jgi:hypothetical protein
MEPFDPRGPEKEPEGRRRWFWPAAALFIVVCSLLAWFVIVLFFYALAL